MAFIAFQAFLGILKAADIAVSSPGLTFSGPLWYSMIILLYLIMCAAVLYAMPKVARGRFQFLDSPRYSDLVLAACILGYLLLVPRLYGNGSDPWELIPNVSIDPMSAESFHNMTIAVCTVIAAGGAFYNPLVGFAISTAWMATIVERSNTLCDMRERSLNTTATECAYGQRMRVLDGWPQLVATLIIVVYHERTVHFQFACAVTMQRMAAGRIEQLRREKERLDYERQMEGRKLDQICARLNGDLSSGASGSMELLSVAGNALFQLSAARPKGGSASSGSSVELTQILTHDAQFSQGVRPALRLRGADSDKGSSGMGDSASQASFSAASHSSEMQRWTCAERNTALERTLAESGLIEV